MVLLVMDPSSQTTQGVHFVLLIRAREDQVLDELTHRTALELTIADSPVPLDLDFRDGFHYRWLALGAKGRADQLASLQTHVMRVEQLYGDSQSGARVELTLGYFDEHKIVKGARSNSKDRIDLGQGVWGEIVLRREPGGRFEPDPLCEDLWGDFRSVDFINSIES